MYKGKDILITCHCKTQLEVMHSKLYVTTMNSDQETGAVGAGTGEGTNEDVLIEQAGFKSVQYLEISPKCPPQEGQYHSWSCVPNESFDYIFTENCPIYEILYRPKNKTLSSETIQAWNDILNESYRILRQNGKLIIPFREHEPHFKNILKKRFQANEIDDAFQFQQYKNYIQKKNTRWQIEMGNINTVGFFIHKAEEDKKYTTMLILTKLESHQGGKRKYQTKKKKSKKRQTKKKN
jgi:hypothetical protein